MANIYVAITGSTDTEQTKSISAATKATNCQLTISGHGMLAGQVFVITGVGGMTQLNNMMVTVVSVVDTNNVTIDVNSTAFGTYTTGGTATMYSRFISNITQANPCVVTCQNHGLSTNDKVYFNAVEGMTELNGKGYIATVSDPNTFSINVNSMGFTAYTSGGNCRKAYATTTGAISATGTIDGADTVVLEQTGTHTQYTSANCTWTFNSATVNTSASLVGSIAVGDYVMRSVTCGDGNQTEMPYRVIAITSTAITLEGRYCGTTGTDTASIYKLVPNTTMLASTSVGIAITKSITVSGGWNYTTISKSGETWIRQTGARTTAANLCIASSTDGIVIQYINIVDSYHGMSCSGNTDFKNCTIVGPYYRCFNLTGPSKIYTFDTCVGGANTLASGTAYHIESPSTTFSNCFATGLNSNTSPCVEIIISSGVFDFTGLTIKCCGYGLQASLSSVKIIGANISYANAGLNITSSNFNRYIYNMIIDNCTYGLYINGLAIDVNVDTCTITNCSNSGIYITQSRGIYIRDCTFSGNNRDCYTDNYSSDVTAINCTSTSPTTYMFERTTIAGTTNIIDCSIDVPSIDKKYNVIANDQLAIPQYVIHNSFGGFCGRVYGRGNVQREITTLLPNGNYSTYIGLNSTVTTNYASWEVDSIYVKSGVAQNITYQLRANGAWVGTLTPILKLNGVVIKTGSNITSISNGSWDEKTISVNAGEVTEDGVLSLEFCCNMNTVGIYTGITSVT